MTYRRRAVLVVLACFACCFGVRAYRDHTARSVAAGVCVENFSAIHAAMKEDDVLRLLGPSNCSHLLPSDIRAWQTMDLAAIVLFDDEGWVLEGRLAQGDAVLREFEVAPSLFTTMRRRLVALVH